MVSESGLSRSAAETERLGAALAHALAAEPGFIVVLLEGDLGAGKTTLVRGLLAALGHAGPVPSPTYTLVEPYELGGRRVYHLDLYRVGDPDELETLGLRDWAAEGAACLVEWPERAPWLAGRADLRIALALEDAHLRGYRIEALSGAGRRLLERIAGPDTASASPRIPKI